MTGHGNLSNGLLRLIARNTFKAFGAYRFNYGIFSKRMETEIGGGQLIYQGTRSTSYVNVQIVGTTRDAEYFVRCSSTVAAT